MGERSSVFISYSSKDRDFVVPVVKAEESLSWSAYIDSESIAAGSDWQDAIDAAIVRSHRFVLCWSANSAQSVQVEREWRLALEFGCVVIPVLIDNTPLPAELAEYHAIDLREYMRSNCRLISGQAALLGAFVGGVGAALIYVMMNAMVNQGAGFWRVCGVLLGCLLALIGAFTVRYWLKWLKLLGVVEKHVLRDLRAGYDPGRVRQQRQGKAES